MSHKLSELGRQPDGFICFNNPDEVVSDEEFEEIKNELAKMRKEALKMLAEGKNEKVCRKAGHCLYDNNTGTF